jgi:hypothetical protein
MRREWKAREARKARKVVKGECMKLSKMRRRDVQVVQNAFVIAPSVSDGNIPELPELPVFSELPDRAVQNEVERCPK